MRKKNPDRYEEISRLIERFTAEYGRSPSIREISAEIGMPATSVFRYVKDMKERGELVLQGPRSIKTRSMIQTKGSTVKAPILSSLYAISCGSPALADQYIEEYVNLPVSLFGTGDLYILETQGDSMIGAGINSGDKVVIRRQDYAEPGQIVVALLGDETTLKRYFPEPEQKRIRLQPENEKFEPIYVSECRIQGVAVHVLKQLE